VLGRRRESGACRVMSGSADGGERKREETAVTSITEVVPPIFVHEARVAEKEGGSGRTIAYTLPTIRGGRGGENG